MSAAAPKAVFLSYASQDAVAARKICDALRAASVEVWFDQSELRGGDAWDQKIRRQIKECALFVPIVSANTQARREGYFRLEWKLAEDRTHLMARGTPFLLPVCIDDTKDWDAIVPESFTLVQWTRLPGGEDSARFCERVSVLLHGESSPENTGRKGNAGESDAGNDGRRTINAGQTREGAARSGRPRRLLVFSAIAAVLLITVGGFAFRGWKHPAQVTPLAVVPAATPRVSEARQLALRVRSMTLEKYSSTPDDYAAAEPLIKRALELDPSDAEIWATSSLFNIAMGTRGFDHAPARREVARSHAERALSLDPESIEGLYALGRWQRDNEPNQAVAEATFKKVLDRAPNHGPALLTLAIHYMRRDRLDEALPLFEKAATRPELRALALYNMFLGYFSNSRFVEAERAVRESIATETSSVARAGLAFILLTVKGDPEAAAKVLATGPGATRSEHRTIWITAYTHLLRHAPEDALRSLERLSDDFLQDNWFVGPKAYWEGRAHALAGRHEAARIAWEAGLAVMRTKLAKDPQNAGLRVMQAELYALLGRKEEALREAKAVEELQHGPFWIWPLSPARAYAALGRAEEALAFLRTADERQPGEVTGWPLSTALLRMDPSWDNIRSHPKFVAKLAAAAAAEQAAASAESEGSRGEAKKLSP